MVKRSNIRDKRSKKAIYSTIGSSGVQNREKRNKIGLKYRRVVKKCQKSTKNDSKSPKIVLSVMRKAISPCKWSKHRKNAQIDLKVNLKAENVLKSGARLQPLYI